MFDPLSIAALSAMAGAVTTGMGNEAGKRAFELIGGLATRIAGREVPAPDAGDGPAAWDGLVQLLREGAEREPRHAERLTEVQALVRTVLARPPTASGTVWFPSGVRFFTDRQEALRRLTREASRKADGRPRRVLLYGPEGIGTSALAVQWARAHTGFSAAQRLYVDLRGESPAEGRDPAVALRELLAGLGLQPDDIPPAAHDRARLFGRLTEDRRLLVVLDHAQSAAQVQPLLGGGSGVFTIVVARRRLPGLDAEPVEVGPLRPRDATRLLTDVAGKEAVASARAVLPSLLERCAGRPYALLAAAAELTGDDPQPRSAAAVPGARQRQGGVPRDDDPVRASAVHAYARLPEDAARCYRLWALRPWPSLDPAAAAAIADIPGPAAARLLDRLAEARLLQPTGHGGHRYPDGVRRHAEAQAAEEDGLAACTRAVRRALTHHLDFAAHADKAALPHRWHLGRVARQATPDRYASPGAALTALTTELGNLIQAVHAADEFQDHAMVCQLTEALWAVQLKAGRHDELLPVLGIAARVADEHCPGTRMAGRMHTQYAFALMELRQHAAAEAQLRQGAEAVRQAGDPRGVATAVESLGLLRLAQWRWQEALDCFTDAAATLDGIEAGAEGHADLPRARALLHRHRGRALRGLDRLPAAVAQSETALARFRAIGDEYNRARTLTDLAETHLKAGAPRAALPLIDEALEVLAAERAGYHVSHLRALRDQCADRAAITEDG